MATFWQSTQSTDPVEEKINDAAETCSIVLTLIKKEIEEQAEKEMAEIIERVATLCPRIEKSTTEVQRLGKRSERTKKLLGDNEDFAKEMSTLNDNVVDPICQLAEEIAQMLDGP